MLILALDAALPACSAALVRDGAVVAQRVVEGDRGQASVLPGLADEVLGEARPDAVAVTVGPGGFTGLRAALALAHGFALGFGCPLVPVTVGEAMAEALPHLGGRVLWTAIDSKRGRVFLEVGGVVRSVALDALPAVAGRVAVAGDAGREVAAWLAARGDDVMLTDARRVVPRLVAIAAARRLAGALPALAAVPIYVEPPQTRAPAVAPRPLPV